MIAADYSDVTEQVGDWITPEALAMLYGRYRYASEYCAKKRVLEVACGPGIGLEYLTCHATRLIGGDVTKRLLDRACRQSRSRFDVVMMDAQDLPFHGASLDLVICYEALYFFPRPERFLRECRRVLHHGGMLLLSTVNPEWPDFNPSPRGSWYFGATDLDRILREQGFLPHVYGAFPVVRRSTRDQIVSWIKRAAIQFGLIPSTMKGKQWLKRLFYGPLIPVPAVLQDGMTTYHAPVPVEIGRSVRTFKILFAEARPA